MERRVRLSGSWQRATLTALVAVMMIFSFAYPSNAVGEPTVTISLDDSTLTVGETATVTFDFSDTPVGFSNDDVDLSDANGTLSTVEPTPDPRHWTATFTPTAGVRDSSNTIGVGTAWSSAGSGQSPLDVAVSPSFSVQTVSSSNPCPPTPSVTIGSPNGGEVFVSGSDVDVFWSMDGCQVTSLSLLLSSDGGASYVVFATSSQPTSGYYRWTVPDAPSSASLLQARLHGPGGEVLASDTTDAPFVIQSAPAPTESGAAPPPPPAPAPAPSSTPPPPAPSSTPTTPPPTNDPPPPAPIVEPLPPSPTQPSAQQTFPGPMAPPMPNIPMPLIAATQTPATSAPITDTPMNFLSQNNPLTDTAASAVTLGMVLSFFLGALMMFGVQQVIKGHRARSTKRCIHCLGSGEEPPEKKALVMCGDCGGTGKVEDENEPGMECKHCKGEGEDPCHHCKGRGADAAGQECKHCKGGGKTLTGKQDEAGGDEVAECEVCHGEGEVSSTIKKMVTCEKCEGKGKV